MLKQSLFSIFLFASTFLLVSWCPRDHRLVALIAERHLTPQAKAAVRDLLHNQTLAEVSSWADQVKVDSIYSHTLGWHYINVTPGLSKEEFGIAINRGGRINLFKAIRDQEFYLRYYKSPRGQQVEALKYLIHLIADAHHPLHMLVDTDPGSRRAQKKHSKESAELNLYWESLFPDKNEISDTQLVAILDTVCPKRIQEWQGETSYINWLYESYEINAQLYSGLKSSRKLKGISGQLSFEIVSKRIEQAGVRLAGVLNQIFKNYLASGDPQQAIVADNAFLGSDELKEENSRGMPSLKYKGGEVITFMGKVLNHNYGNHTAILNVYDSNSNQRLKVVLKGVFKSIAANLDGKTITVSGKVLIYGGIAQIQISSSDKIKVQE
jgi:hypothetical protein